MPIYVYKCPQCGQQFDKLQPFSAANVYPCPNCQTEAKRQIQAAGIVFKGSGWYITDSRKADEARLNAETPSKPASAVAAPSEGGSTASSEASTATAPATPAPTASIEPSSKPA